MASWLDWPTVMFDDFLHQHVTDALSLRTAVVCIMSVYPDLLDPGGVLGKSRSRSERHRRENGGT